MDKEPRVNADNLITVIHACVIIVVVASVTFLAARHDISDSSAVAILGAAIGYGTGRTISKTNGS